MLKLPKQFEIERSDTQHGMHRFFATAVVDEYTKLWHVWVTAVCDKETGREYIADIRLGPNNFRSTAPPG